MTEPPVGGADGPQRTAPKQGNRVPLPHELQEEEGIPEAIAALRAALQNPEVHLAMEAREEIRRTDGTMKDFILLMREKGVSPKFIQGLTGATRALQNELAQDGGQPPAGSS